MRLTKLEQFRRGLAPEAKREQKEVTLEEIARLLVHPTKPLLPTQKQFIFSHERIALFMGPVGSAKTASLVASAILPGLLYPGASFGIFRWTWWTLEQTTLQDFMAAIDRLGSNIIVDRQAGPPLRLWIQPGVPGEPVEYVFHGLDDMGKLGSTKFNGIFVDEAAEIGENMAHTLDTRLRKPLPGQDEPEGPFFLRLACNPVPRSHWIHRQFCGESDCDSIPWGKKFKPLPKENERNLPPGYYDTISKGMSPMLKIRLIEGECGPDPSGKPVFPEFRASLHVAELKVVPGIPITRSWDFGRRRPAILFGQRLPNGHLNRLYAKLGENQTTTAFAKEVLGLSANLFPNCKTWLDVCDPHGTQKKSNAEKSDIELLNELNIRPMYRDTTVKRGLDLMSEGLCTLKDGRPLAQYDRHGCATLIEGYLSGYSYPEPRPGHELKEEPVKDGFYEHLMDCDRYFAVNQRHSQAAPPGQHRRVLRRVRNPVTGY